MLQVIIFVKSVQRCMALAQLLVEQNFPAIAIHRAMTQEERYFDFVLTLNILLNSFRYYMNYYYPIPGYWVIYIST